MTPPHGTSSVASGLYCNVNSQVRFGVVIGIFRGTGRCHCYMLYGLRNSGRLNLGHCIRPQHDASGSQITSVKRSIPDTALHHHSRTAQSLGFALRVTRQYAYFIPPDTDQEPCSALLDHARPRNASTSSHYRGLEGR